MVTFSLTCALFLLAVLAVLQVMAALGLPVGRFVWGGRHRVLPAKLRVSSGIAVALYAAFSALLLSRSGVIPGDGIVISVATWLLFGYFALGILMNAISRSRLERFTMTPISIVLTGATLVIALAS